MEKEFDVIALGELLIDFTMNGKSEQGNNLFEANPGGAPCNVLAILRKLGKKTAFIGKVGDDQFGRLLRETIEEAGINSDNLLVDKEINTTLAFVHTFPDGDREFSFYRKPGADMMLKKEEIDEEAIAKARIFHFGTLSMTHEDVREATLKALELAKKNGLLISLDPNLRPPLCLPFDLSKDMITEIFGNETKVYSYDGYQNGELSFSIVKEVKAGMPFLMRSEYYVEQPTFAGVTVGSTTAQTVGGGEWDLCGTFGSYELAADGTQLFLTDCIRFL